MVGDRQRAQLGATIERVGQHVAAISVVGVVLGLVAIILACVAIARKR